MQNMKKKCVRDQSRIQICFQLINSIGLQQQKADPLTYF